MADVLGEVSKTVNSVVDTVTGAVGGAAGGAAGGAVGGALGASVGTAAAADVTPGTSTLDKRILQAVSMLVALLAILKPGLNLNAAAQASIASVAVGVAGVIEWAHASLARR